MSLLPFGGGVLDVSGTPSAQDVNAVVCCAANGAHGEYTNFGFNSVAVIGGAAYGCKADGVYTLSGADDAGTDIPSAIYTGVTDFANDRYPDAATRQKRIDSCYLNGRLSDPGVNLVVGTDEEVDVLYEEALPADANHGISPHRIKVGKGMKGRNWQFGVENIDGSDFTIDTCEPQVIQLSRRT